MPPTESDATLDAAVVAHSRVLPLDVVHAKGSGHGGTAVGVTPALYVLFQEVLRHDPAAPDWAGRDHFVLSCGHVSLALYVQLLLTGYGLDLDDLRRTRTIGSLTPGHPERGLTPGVEVTTGPLGQGIANAVGMALASQRRQALLDPDTPSNPPPFFRRTWCLASDGDMQEGISHEAASFAGALQLDNLIVVWDDNGISIEGDTAITFREDVAARHRAYGWTVVEISDAEDLDAIRAGYKEAVDSTGPVLVRLRTRIGHPMPTVGGTAGAHSGDPGDDEIRETKRLLGLNPDDAFNMPEGLLDHARRAVERGRKLHADWDEVYTEWAARHPDRAELMQLLDEQEVPAEVEGVLQSLALRPRGVATRKASAAVLDAISAELPWLWGGSADLAGSNGVAINGAGSILPPDVTSSEWPPDPRGPLVHFGIREHAMGAIGNGIAVAGAGMPFLATFLVFSDYMRPAIRLAALMQLRVVYVFSHDSVAVGEDGPTHQPVEQLWSLRSVPGLAVVRPADWTETVEAWRKILTGKHGPIALVLSRQSAPPLSRRTPPEVTRTPHVDQGNPTALGGYIVAGYDQPDALAVATGTEVSLAMQARQLLAREGVNLRVVSMPCVEWFDQQPDNYRDDVIPPQVRARVSVEAGTPMGWHRFIGLEGVPVAVRDFGASGDGDDILSASGITVEAIVDAVHDSLRLTAASLA